jgi:hypothetical protein
VGAALILWAYGAQQFGRMDTTGLLYAVLNFFGSGVLATVAGTEKLWGFVILNSVWALVSARTAVRALGANNRPR